MKESDIISIPRAISWGDVPGGVSLVKGDEFGMSYSGRKDFRDCVTNVFDIFKNSCMAGCLVSALLNGLEYPRHGSRIPRIS